MFNLEPTNITWSHARDLRNACMLACLHACMLACLHSCLGGSSDASRVRARARYMIDTRWLRYLRSRGRLEIGRHLTKIKISKRSIISRARVATDCAGASTPNHVLRHAARPHARCGCFDVPNALGDGRAQDRVDRAVGSNARTSLRKPSCSLIDVDFYVGPLWLWPCGHRNSEDNIVADGLCGSG